MSETLFKKVDYSLTKLLHDIDHGDIGLPDIQRPFVWKPTRVRDLFDSMYRGFPVGYLLFWDNDNMKGVKSIGTDGKQSAPRLLIVDGQQRLTSLYAVLKGRPVFDDQYRAVSLRIAFHLPTEQFEVADAATVKDPEFIPDISELWAPASTSYNIVKKYLARLGETRELTKVQEHQYAKAIDRLYDLQNYPFTAMEISGSVDEQRVAEIFVRINSKGVKLNQADFILTLMSVFWDEGRRDLETFCRRTKYLSDDNTPSPFNRLFQPDPDQLLRVTVAYGFSRAVLKNVYSLLRGRSIETGEFSEAKRDEQFATLMEAQGDVVNLTYWHDFLKAIASAGFRSESMILSQTAVIYAYALFLIGRVRHGVEPYRLRRIIGRWFFASAIASRLSGSFESLIESELGRMREVDSPEAFLEEVDRTIRLTLTSDFWEVTLPNALDSSGARTPSLYAYHAALCILKSPALFSKMTVWELLDPTVHPKKSNLDRHHLFPKAYLRRQSVTDKKVINQIANLTLLEWPDDIQISDAPPSTYVPEVRKRFNDSDWEKMCAAHALPDLWWKMSYEDFLPARRALMAQVIRRAFDSL